MSLVAPCFTIIIFASSCLARKDNLDVPFKCFEPLRRQKQDDLPSFDPSKYMAGPPCPGDSCKPYNIHFILTPDLEPELRPLVEKVMNAVNNMLSGIIKAPPLSEVRRARKWNATGQKCEPGLCARDTVPGEYLLPCHNPLTNFIVPEPGVPWNPVGTVRELNTYKATTLVVYLFAGNRTRYYKDRCVGGTGVGASAESCQWDPVTNRATHGMVGMCLGADELRRKRAERILLHEILHLVTAESLSGFGSPALGCPYEYHRRDQAILRCENVTYRKIPYKSLLPNGTYVDKTRVVTITPHVRKAVQDHFRCGLAEGAEVMQDTYADWESEAVNWTIPVGTVVPTAHWSYYLFPDEILMPAALGGMVLSTITLSYLKDTGWYNVNMSAAEPMEVTRPPAGQDGCLFFQKSCLEVIQRWRGLKRTLQGFSPRMGPYCDPNATLGDQRVMTKDCINDMEPLECQALPGGCGIVLRPIYYVSTKCNETEISPFNAPEMGSQVGPRTLCLSIGPVNLTTYKETAILGICVHYHCGVDTLVLTITPYGNITCIITCRPWMSNLLTTFGMQRKKDCSKYLGERYHAICPTFEKFCQWTDVKEHGTSTASTSQSVITVVVIIVVSTATVVVGG